VPGAGERSSAVNARSVELLLRARRSHAVLATRSGIIGDPIATPGSPPVFAQRAKGAYVWDVDGRRYVDLVLGFGSVVLGHADERVTAAVTAAMESGVAPTLSSPLEIELAELLVDVVPGAEMVALLRTGSDATAAAVRLARAFTERPYVLHWGYHGWHEWCATRPAGLTPGVGDHTITFRYNDLDGLRELMSRWGSRTACILMMPYELEPPEAGYLEAVAAIARGNGALFVLDEVRSGFRLAMGGAQEHFGVRADLVALSKAMSNGHPISAVVGRRDVMELVGAISVSSVFFRACDGMAAALATIRTLRDDGVVDVLWQRGRALMDGMAAAAGRHRVPVTVTGLPPTPFHVFHCGSAELDERAMSVFCETTREHGILVHPGHHWFVCGSMSQEDVDLAVTAMDAGYAAVARALELRA